MPRQTRSATTCGYRPARGAGPGGLAGLVGLLGGKGREGVPSLGVEGLFLLSYGGPRRVTSQTLGHVPKPGARNEGETLMATSFVNLHRQPQ